MFLLSPGDAILIIPMRLGETVPLEQASGGDKMVLPVLPYLLNYVIVIW